MTTFTQYAQAAKAKDSSLFLGSLAWYNVSETKVRHADLEASLKANALDFACPRAPRDEDVFRRCAPNGHVLKVSTTNDQIHVNYMIRQVKRGGGSCTKHIVSETVDAAGETLGYEEVHFLTYNGKTNTLEHGPIGVGDYTAAGIAAEIEGDFNRTRGFVDGNAIRSIIRRVMDEARATNVRPTGGVYFVMEQYAPLLHALENSVNGVPGAGVHSLPLVDDSKQRDMLRKAYESETVEEVERAMAEMATLLASPEITSEQFGRLSAKYSVLNKRNKEYMDLLQDTLDVTDTKLTLFKAQMSQLLGKVKS